MRFTTAFIDLDGTLYPGDNGLWEAIGERMNEFICERVGIPRSEVAQLREEYFLAYGTTLQGLKRFHGVDELEYLTYVHDVPLDPYIHADPELRRMLAGMPQKKWIFTNGDRNHARRVMEAVGVRDCFDGVVDILAMEGENKPNAGVYPLAMRLAGERDGERCIYVDDIAANLTPAKELGMYTVLVGAEAQHPAADRCIPRLHELVTAVPELMD